MEHIEVTEEMRERVLTNIAQKRKRRKIIQIVRFVSAAAACCVVVFGAAYYLKHRPDKPPQQPEQTTITTSIGQVTDSSAGTTGTTGITQTTGSAASMGTTTHTTAVQSVTMPTTVTTPDASINPLTEYKSAAELRDATGIPIFDVKSVPFKVKETFYCSSEKFAEISYSNDTDLCCIRVSKDESDQSGFYFDEETVQYKHIEVNGVPVTLTTDIEGTYVASWMQDGRFHSVGLIAENNAETILPIVSEIMGQKPAEQP